jgi:uncharacterized membrane protein
MLGMRLTTIHNLYYLLDLMKQIRQAIMDDSFQAFREAFFARAAKNAADGSGGADGYGGIGSAVGSGALGGSGGSGSSSGRARGW